MLSPWDRMRGNALRMERKARKSAAPPQNAGASATLKGAHCLLMRPALDFELG